MQYICVNRIFLHFRSILKRLCTWLAPHSSSGSRVVPRDGDGSARASGKRKREERQSQDRTTPPFMPLGNLPTDLVRVRLWGDDEPQTEEMLCSIMKGRGDLCIETCSACIIDGCSTIITPPNR